MNLKICFDGVFNTGIRGLAVLTVFCFSTMLGAAEFRVIAGNGEAGFADGSDARFFKPIRLAPFGPGRILVADINNHAIRSVTLDGEVLTLAGGPDKRGHRDGPAAEAGFDNPHGVAVSPGGLIVVAGAGSHTIRLLTPVDDGYEVSTLAGVAGESGFRDGPADKALFYSPHAVVWDAEGGLLVVDIGNASIRRIKDGVVTTVATADTSEMVMPIDMMPAGDGSYLIADAGIQKVLRWSPGDKGEVLAADTEMVMPHGVAGDADGNVYVAEIYAHRITELIAGETPKRVAGTGSAGSGPDQLNKPAGVLVHDGYLWIADLDNHRISVIPLDALTAGAEAEE
jgi:DNA-binding beta-propeller fold protein YncE